MPQTIWIARHGNRLDFVHPEWFNTAKRRYDPPLSDDGLIQAQKLAQRLKNSNIKHIFTSPFLRAIQTANPVAEILDLSLKIEAGLSEWLNPDWMSETPQTHPTELLTQSYPRIDWSYQSCVMPQYPETEATMLARSSQTAQKLVSIFKEDLLLVGHSASVTGTTQGLVTGNPEIKTSLCCLVKIVANCDRWLLQLNGDTSHL